MIGMTIDEFINKVYYGNEIEFKIGNTTYFIQGKFANKKYYLTVDFWNKDDGTEPNHDYLFAIECDSRDERIHKFEDANIFNGKNIYQIESIIEVVFG